jgi:hypothetical protein
MTETVSEAHDRFPRFSLEIGVTMIYAPGLLRIGGTAYVCIGGPAQFRVNCPKARTSSETHDSGVPHSGRRDDRNLAT